MIEESNKNEVAVLFSGGRDSSLATCLLAKSGNKLHLVTTFNGAVIKGELSNYRYDELKSIFPDNILKRVIIPSFSLFRRIALVDIEEDFSKYKKNLIPVGDAITSHAEAIVYCLKNNVSIIASGYTRYESNYPEQIPEAINLMHKFLGEYNLKYITPVLDYDSLDKVKYRLFDFGVSTKSLEGTSLFSDTYSTPEPEIVAEYISNKLGICHEYINFKIKGIDIL